MGEVISGVQFGQPTMASREQRRAREKTIIQRHRMQVPEHVASTRKDLGVIRRALDEGVMEDDWVVSPDSVREGALPAGPDGGAPQAHWAEDRMIEQYATRISDYVGSDRDLGDFEGLPETAEQARDQLYYRARRQGRRARWEKGF